MHSLKELKILLTPILVSLIITLIWFFIRKPVELNNSQLDIGIMASGTIALLGIFYALLAAFVLATVWQQWTAIEEAITTKNKKEFIKYKDKRIPFTVKLLVFIFSAMIICSFFLISFNALINGLFSIFSITFALTTYWSVINDLDNPFEGIWNVKIPKEWNGLLKSDYPAFS